MERNIRMTRRVVLILIALAFAVNISAGAATSTNTKSHPQFKCIWKIDRDINNKSHGYTDDYIYYTDKTSYGVYDINTGKLLWRRYFKRKHSDLTMYANNNLFLINVDDQRLLACRLSDGETLWNIERRTYQDPILVKNYILYETKPDTLTAYNVKDFSPAWTCRLDSVPVDRKELVKAGDIYPYAMKHSLVGINLNNGSIVYRTELEGKYLSKPEKFANRVYVTGISNNENDEELGRLWAFNASTGKQMWEYKFKRESFPQLILTADQVVLYFPYEKRLSAVNRYSGNFIWQRIFDIERLGPVYPIGYNNQLIFATRSHILGLDSHGNNIFGQEFNIYEYDSWIQHASGKGFVKSNDRTLKGYIMGEDEPLPEDIPWLIDIIQKRRNTTRDAIEELAKSHDPRAVDLLISMLNDPNTPIYIRMAAYRSMARSGEDSSIKAVLAARDISRTIAPLKQRLVIEDPTGGDWIGEYSKDTKHPYLLATQKDSDGALWGLMKMGIVGNRNDLWIARWKDNKWQYFIFTGDAEEKPDLSNWFAKYVGNKLLEADTDNDGLTDLIEHRYGTSTDNPDSDGDGLIDSIDKNPLTAPRELNETEQILAAAFEGYYNKLSADQSPAVVVFPEGVEPFELFGLDGIILPKSRIQNKPIDKFIGEGTFSTRFNTPYMDVYGNILGREARDVQIQWNDDHTEAVIGLSCHIANLSAEGCDIRLRKINGTWFVIKVKSLWVS